jgi:hypothetical protein
MTALHPLIGLNEIPLKDWVVLHCRNTTHRQRLLVLNQKIFVNKVLGFVGAGDALVHDVEGVEVLELGVDTVSRVSGTQPIAPVALVADRGDDYLAVNELTPAMDYSTQTTA